MSSVINTTMNNCRTLDYFGLRTFVNELDQTRAGGAAIRAIRQDGRTWFHLADTARFAVVPEWVFAHEAGLAGERVIEQPDGEVFVSDEAVFRAAHLIAEDFNLRAFLVTIALQHETAKDAGLHPCWAERPVICDSLYPEMHLLAGCLVELAGQDKSAA